MSTNTTLSAGTTSSAAARVWVPSSAELADLELLLDGAYLPLTGFLGAGDAKSVSGHGQLSDGTAWPAPVLLRIPAEFGGHTSVELRDQEGAPLAIVDGQVWSDGSATYLGGAVRSAEVQRCRSFARLRPPAAEVRATLPHGPVLGVVTDRPLHRCRLAQIRFLAGELGASVLVLPRLAGPRPEAVVQAILAAKPELPARTTVVPIPLLPRENAERDLLLSAHVAAAYGATHLIADGTADPSPIPIETPPLMARDAEGRWWPQEAVPAGHPRGDLSDAELASRLDTGASLPGWFTSPAIARQQAKVHPPLTERGFTVLLTGLSGAGKSTVARGLRDELMLHDDRAVTLLDGDVVRRELSAGLGFSAEDRSRNVRRIGWVAAEVTRHGGAAICAPIAPYAGDRAHVRDMVGAVGGFVLVHVATPLDECERRDRKGLYALAREGLLPEFTGVSAPYEPPEDADLVLDTSVLTPDQAVSQVVGLLRARGWVRPRQSA